MLRSPYMPLCACAFVGLVIKQLPLHWVAGAGIYDVPFVAHSLR